MDPVRPNCQGAVGKTQITTETRGRQAGVREEISPMDEDIPDDDDDDDQVIEQAYPGSGGQEPALGEGRDQEVQQRAAAARALPCPVIPTKAEREEHELTHVTCAMVSTLRKSHSDE